MKRILILTILLMSSLAWAGSTTVVVGQGGGGQSFEYLQSAQGTTGASPRTVQLTDVQAGSLIVVWVPWFYSESTACTVSDGTSNFKGGTVENDSWMRGQFFYLLSSVASGTVTYTATVSGCSNVAIQVWEIGHTQAVSLDQENTTNSPPDSTAPNSGNITLSQAPSIVFGGLSNYNGPSVSSRLINGETATASQTIAGNAASSWYKIFSSTFSDGAASCTLASSVGWRCNVISFK